MTFKFTRKIVATLVCAAAAFFSASAHADPLPFEQARQLSAFGERPAFSPDGRRVAFLDKAYGNAFEIELSTGRIRNLTGAFPHQGIVRIQYLQNGDYLITAPRVYVGANSRINLELFVLDRRLRTGLQPLNTRAFEGVAVGPNDTLMWQQLPDGRTIGANDNWMMAFVRESFEHYTGRVIYENGQPRIADRRLVTATPPEGCGFWEVQDFRDHGAEAVFTCAGVGPGVAPGPRRMGIFGVNLSTGQTTTYIPMADHYVEVEGVAPDGSWATVECSDAEGALPSLNICRLELTPNGALTPLIHATQPNTPRGISNSVVSPDGRWIAFQRSDVGVGEPGAGQGVFLAPAP